MGWAVGRGVTRRWDIIWDVKSGMINENKTKNKKPEHSCQVCTSERVKSHWKLTLNFSHLLSKANGRITLSILWYKDVLHFVCMCDQNMKEPQFFLPFWPLSHSFLGSLLTVASFALHCSYWCGKYSFSFWVSLSWTCTLVAKRVNFNPTETAGPESFEVCYDLIRSGKVVESDGGDWQWGA